MTNFFLVFGHGQSAGTWFCACCNNFPDPPGMTVLGELHHHTQLDFKGRGLDKSSFDLDQAALDFFADSIYFKKACAGIMVSFRRTAMDFVEKHGGHIAQKMRNPLYIVTARSKAKPRAAAYTFEKHKGRAPRDEKEKFWGLCTYYRDNFYARFLNRAHIYPLIRIEDLNTSLGGDRSYYKSVMEWLTQTEWPDDYIEYIATHFYPGFYYQGQVEWEGDRVKKFNQVREEAPRWGRENWDEDPYPKKCFDILGDRGWQEIYLDVFRDIQPRLGYNNAYIGSVDRRWEYRGKAPWKEE